MATSPTKIAKLYVTNNKEFIFKKLCSSLYSSDLGRGSSGKESFVAENLYWCEHIKIYVLNLEDRNQRN